MKIPQMQLHITNAEMGLNIQKPQQHIEQPPADMQIKQPAAELSISTEEGMFSFDYTQFWRDLGLTSLTEVAQKFAQKGVQEGLEGIARRAREGRQMMDIAHNKNAFANISRAKNPSNNLKQLGMDFIPSYQAIKLSYKPAEVNIDVKRNEPQIDVQINKPVYDYTPGSVKVEMLQQPSVKIDWRV